MKKYYVVENGAAAGPLSLDELRERNIKRDDLVWMEGMDDWAAAGSVAEIATIFIVQSKPAETPDTILSTDQQPAPKPKPQPAAEPRPTVEEEARTVPLNYASSDGYGAKSTVIEEEIIVEEGEKPAFKPMILYLSIAALGITLVAGVLCIITLSFFLFLMGFPSFAVSVAAVVLAFLAKSAYGKDDYEKGAKFSKIAHILALTGIGLGVFGLFASFIGFLGTAASFLFNI